MSKLEFYEYLLKLESQSASLLDSLSLLSDGKNSRIEHARRRAFARWSKRYDARRNHEEFMNNAVYIGSKFEFHSGDFVRLPASASALAKPEQWKERSTGAGQGGNQTPKQQCKNHSVNELFCCCDDCTSSFIPPLYSVQYLDLIPC